MPRVCTICTHEQRIAIDQEISQGVSIRKIASHYFVGYQSVMRHKQNCVKQIVTEAKKERTIETAITVLGDLEWAHGESQELYRDARAAGDMRTASMILDGFVRQTKFRAELTGELKRQNIFASPELQEFIGAFFAWLSMAHPDVHEESVTWLEVERAKRRSA